MSRDVSDCGINDGCILMAGHAVARLLPRDEEMCSKCKGEGEVGGYLDDACTCCTEGGCGSGSGCSCWHQGEDCDRCGGTGVEPR